MSRAAGWRMPTASISSSRRRPASSSASTVGLSGWEASPSVATTTTVGRSCSAARASRPPQARVSSSGWATTTTRRSRTAGSAWQGPSGERTSRWPSVSSGSAPRRSEGTERHCGSPRQVSSARPVSGRVKAGGRRATARLIPRHGWLTSAGGSRSVEVLQHAPGSAAKPPGVRPSRRDDVVTRAADVRTTRTPACDQPLDEPDVLVLLERLEPADGVVVVQPDAEVGAVHVVVVLAGGVLGVPAGQHRLGQAALRLHHPDARRRRRGRRGRAGWSASPRAPPRRRRWRPARCARPGAASGSVSPGGEDPGRAGGADPPQVDRHGTDVGEAARAPRRCGRCRSRARRRPRRRRSAGTRRSRAPPGRPRPGSRRGWPPRCGPARPRGPARAA